MSRASKGKALKAWVATTIAIAAGSCTHPKPAPEKPPEPLPALTQVGATGAVYAPEPIPASTAQANSAEIKFIFPKAGDVVSSPFEFDVQIEVKPAGVSPPYDMIDYTLKNEDGSTVKYSRSDEVLKGEKSLRFMRFACPRTKTGFLEARAVSLKTGNFKVLSKASVAVEFKPASAYVALYFLSKDYKGSIFAVPFPVERKDLLKSGGPEAALKELLKGPTPEEQAMGYYTLFQGARLQSLTVENGVAHADFSKELAWCGGGSSCQVAVQAPIYETLEQFCDLKEFFLTVDGSEGPLQP